MAVFPSTLSTVISITVGTWKSTAKFLNSTSSQPIVANVVILPWNINRESFPSTVT